MAFQKINSRIIIRYALFQIPALVILMLLLFLIDHWYKLDNLLIMLIILLWILKDLILFPFVWKSYRPNHESNHKSMVKKRGVAISDFQDSGLVRIDGELWQAELHNPDETISKDDPVEVKDMQGLKLKVSKQTAKQK